MRDCNTYDCSSETTGIGLTAPRAHLTTPSAMRPAPIEPYSPYGTQMFFT